MDATSSETKTFNRKTLLAVSAALAVAVVVATGGDAIAQIAADCCAALAACCEPATDCCP